MNTIKILTVAALLAVPALTVSAQDDTVNTSDNNTSYWLDSEQEGSDKMILHRYHILDNWEQIRENTISSVIFAPQQPCR